MIDLYEYRLDSYLTLIIVTGVIMNPADTRAIAPLVRLAKFDIFGKDDEGCSVRAFKASTTAATEGILERGT